jgi:CHAD domain
VHSWDQEAIRLRAFELSLESDAGTADENWLRAEAEFASVASDYDTTERDLEQSGLTLSRLPGEAGVMWRLRLPRGECVEEWEPGNAGLTPPQAVAQLIDTVVEGKPLAPTPPLSSDPGASRLRELLEEQRQELLRHDPGVRVGEDPENLHEHRVAARRARAFLRATRASLDPDWRRSLGNRLGELGDVTGPVRDVDVLLEHVAGELGSDGLVDARAAILLVATLDARREQRAGHCSSSSTASRTAASSRTCGRRRGWPGTPRRSSSRRSRAGSSSVSRRGSTGSASSPASRTCTGCGSTSSAPGMPPSWPRRTATPAAASSPTHGHCRTCSASTRTR